MVDKKNQALKNAIGRIVGSHKNLKLDVPKKGVSNESGRGRSKWVLS